MLCSQLCCPCSKTALILSVLIPSIYCTKKRCNCRISAPMGTTVGQHLMILHQSAQPVPSALMQLHPLSRATPALPLVHQGRAGPPLDQTLLPFNLTPLPFSLRPLPLEETPLPFRPIPPIGRLPNTIGSSLIITPNRLLLPLGQPLTRQKTPFLRLKQ